MRALGINLWHRVSERSCVIVGQDGWDICVLINLILFYSSLGFRVYFSKRVELADLIVIMRFDPSVPLSFDGVDKSTPVHIYPYVGHNPARLVQQIKDFPVSVFAPSEALLGGKESVFHAIAYPPVDVSFWSTRSVEKGLAFVHIGNFKKNPGTSTWKEAEELIATLRQEEAHVWGDGWDKIDGIKAYHGPAGILEVPRIYSKTDYALGLMYPYQVECGTISSRFWQAPLCGAPLICERKVRQVIPGVYPLGLDDIERRVPMIKETNAEIQEQARRFWLDKWSDLKQLVSQSLELMPALKTGYIPPKFVLYNVLWLFSKHGIIYA